MNLYEPSLFDVEELHNFFRSSSEYPFIRTFYINTDKEVCVQGGKYGMVWCRLALWYFPGLENLSPTEFFCCVPIGMHRHKSTKAKTCYWGRPHKNKSIYFCIGTFTMLDLFSQLLTVSTRHSSSVACSPELCVACMDYIRGAVKRVVLPVPTYLGCMRTIKDLIIEAPSVRCVFVAGTLVSFPWI